jgi:hypothetical protein
MPMLIQSKVMNEVQTNFDRAGSEIGLNMFKIIRTNPKLKYKSDKKFKRTENVLFFYWVFSSTSLTAL